MPELQAARLFEVERQKVCWKNNFLCLEIVGRGGEDGEGGGRVEGGEAGGCGGGVRTMEGTSPAKDRQQNTKPHF